MSGPRRGEGTGLLVGAGAVVACCGLKVVVLSVLAGGGGVATGNIVLVGVAAIALLALGLWALRRARRDRLGGEASRPYRDVVEARRSVLSPPLERWLAEAEPAERRTAVVRVGSSADPEEVAGRMVATGAEVQSAGPASVLCVVTPEALRHVVKQPGVVAVEEPQQLFPRGPAGPPPS